MHWQGFSLFLRCLPLVARLHKRWQFDCIDGHYIYPDGFAAVLLAKYFGLPVVLSARGTDINLLPTFRLVRKMIKWTLSRADAVVAVSDALKRELLRLGVEEARIHVIPNGVDVARFQPAPAGEARSKLGLPADGWVVVSVGTLVPSKGHELVIRALNRLRERHRDLQLYILGEGAHRGYLEDLVAQLGLRDNVHLIGKRPNEELRYWFSAATVACLASAREGWPNVVTESLACGTPVVATRVGGIPEILHSDDLGVLVDQNLESLVAGLQYALDKAWDRPAIARRTGARTWDDVALELEKVFRAQIDRAVYAAERSVESP